MLILLSISCNPFYSHYGGPRSLLFILVMRIEPRTQISLGMCIPHQPYLFPAKVLTFQCQYTEPAPSLLWRVMLAGQSHCFFAFVIMTFWMRTFQHISYLCCHKPILDILKVFYSMQAINLAHISSTVEGEAFSLLGTKTTFMSLSSYCYIIGWLILNLQAEGVGVLCFYNWLIWAQAYNHTSLCPLYIPYYCSSSSSPHQQPLSVCNH